MITITYTDSRFGDTFNIYVDEKSQDFIGAYRFVDRVGADPIEYFLLSEIPPIHRANVERQIRNYFKRPDGPNPTNHPNSQEVQQSVSEQDGSSI